MQVYKIRKQKAVTNKSIEIEKEINMRKKAFSFLALVIVLCLQIDVVFAAQSISDKNTISYNGNLYNVSDLSEETIEWLEWYYSLPEETRTMISYIPSDLLDILLEEEKLDESAADSINIISLGVSIDNGTADLNDDSGDTGTGGAPVGGYEPVYNPTNWNSSNRINRANCYYYAMDCLSSKAGLDYLQPGYISGKVYISLTKSAIITAVKADCPYLSRSISSTTFSTKPGKNQYKVALFIAPDKDYHWYVQNSNGYWSHKVGLGEVTNLDALGNKIVNPQNCSRNNGNINYSTFCGYYMITRN